MQSPTSAKRMFSPMTSFTGCHKTSLTLPRERASAGGESGMAWRTMDLREQRVRFVVAAHRREKSIAELCREFDISRPVGYEWLRRYEQGGIEAIAERSRRPQRS